ncbi:MAG TPA: ABC transporter permease, partial [Actinomycetales bacterium]|nr:ABC transporter permease [Actinomycetales bacterium]
GDGGVVGDVLVTHLATIPAPLAVLGACVTLFAWAPRLAAPVGWALVALTGVVTVFATLLDLPEQVQALSPLYHLADVPVEEFAPAPFLAVTAVAALAVAIGLAGMRRRQIGG